MECKQYKYQISLYMDKQLDLKEVEQLEYHLGHCSHCNSYYQSLYAIKLCCNNLEEINLPSDFHDNICVKLKGEERGKMSKKFGFRILAGIAASFLLLFIGINLFGNLFSSNKSAADRYSQNSADMVSPGAPPMATDSKQVADADYAKQEESYDASKGSMGMGRDDVGEAEEAPEFERSNQEEPAPPNSGGQPNEVDRKIIKSAYLEAETLEFDRLINVITGKLSALGGYIESSNIRGTPQRNKNISSNRNAHLEMRIPNKKFDQFIEDIGELGNLLTKQINGEDITGQYFDVEARLKSFTIKEERLLTILQKAEKLQDIIELERELSMVRYDIESYTGTLKKWDQMVSYSRISLDIYEVTELKQEEPEKITWGERIVKAFKKSLKDLGDFFENLVVFLVSAVPYLIILAIPVWIIWKTIERLGWGIKKNEKGDEKDE